MVKFKWNINDQIFFINYKYIIILIKQLMIRINPIARTAFRVLQTQITHNFGGPTPLLDPSKHITMGKYSHALFIDEYDIGQYPQVVLPGSIAPKDYQPKVEQILVQTLNKRYNVSLTLNDISNKKWDRLFSKVLKSHENINDLLPILFKRLATDIIVKESRWTWIKQQKMRLDLSQTAFSNEVPETVEQFFVAYNDFIEKLVSISYFGGSAKIRQPPTPQQKELLNDLADSPTGIQDLFEERPENNNLINRFMRSLHS